MITQTRLKKLLDYNPETGVFVWKVSRGNRAVGSLAGRMGTAGYIEIMLDGVRHGAHRLAWLYMTGEWPREEVDHINCVRGDARFANLREASRSGNQQNKAVQKNNTSGHKGVTWHAKNRKWLAQITVASTHMYIGTFDVLEDAAAAYAEASARLHKDFGRTA